MVILLYYTFKVLSNLFIKQPEDIHLDEDHLIVETRWGIEEFILDLLTSFALEYVMYIIVLTALPAPYFNSRGYRTY